MNYGLEGLAVGSDMEIENKSGELKCLEILDKLPFLLI